MERSDEWRVKTVHPIHTRPTTSHASSPCLRVSVVKSLFFRGESDP